MFLEPKTVNDLSYEEVVDKIVNLNNFVKEFWSSAQGWAPNSAANMLSNSRLDWLLSMSHSLYKWEEDPSGKSYNGDLILAWVNLGALTEGAMKLFLSVFYEDYLADANIIKQRGQDIDPDGAMFNGLRNFFVKSIWNNDETHHFNTWLELIQQRRNAIHAFRDREIESFFDFREQVKKYLEFLIYILEKLPIPDEIFGPDLSLGYK